MSDLVPIGRAAVPTPQEAVRMSVQAMRVTGTEMVPRDQRNNTDAILATMLAGWELGLSPMQSLRSFHIIEGKPSESAELLMTMARRRGVDVFVSESTNESCTVEVRHPDWPQDRVGSVTFTIEDAQRAKLAGKGNWEKYPRSMLRSRAVSEAIRTHCPEVTVGASYTPEELGVPVDGLGIPEGRGPEFLSDADPDIVTESIEVLDRDSAALEAKAKAREEGRDPTLDDFLGPFDDDFLATQDLDAMREFAAADEAHLSRTIAVLEKRQAAWSVDGPAEDAPDGDDEPDEGTEVPDEPAEESEQSTDDDGHDEPSDAAQDAGDTDVPPAPDPDEQDAADQREAELRAELDKMPEAFVETQDVDKMVEFARPDDQLLAKALETLHGRLATWREDQPDDTDQGPPPRGYVYHQGSGYYDLYDEDMEFIEKVRGGDNVPAAYVPLPSDPQAADEPDDVDAEDPDATQEEPPEEPPIEVVEEGSADGDGELEPEDVVDAEVVDPDEWPEKVQIYDSYFMIPERDYWEGGTNEGRRRAHEFATRLLDLPQAFAEHLDEQGVLGKSIQFAARDDESLATLLERLTIRYETWAEEQS